MLEVVYASDHPLFAQSRIYDARSIGAAAACPERPLWWLAAALAAGAVAGWQAAAQRRKVR